MAAALDPRTKLLLHFSSWQQNNICSNIEAAISEDYNCTVQTMKEKDANPVVLTITTEEDDIFACVTGTSQQVSETSVSLIDCLKQLQQDTLQQENKVYQSRPHLPVVGPITLQKNKPFAMVEQSREVVPTAKCISTKAVSYTCYLSRI